MERKRIDSKLMLFTLVLVLIVLLLLNWLLSGNRTEEIWNYEKLDSASDIVYLGTKEEDRETYYILESIVQEYLNSFLLEDNNEEDKLDYTKYYDYLTKGYKNYLSQREYNDIAYKFLTKFYVNAKSEYETMNYMDTDHIIRNIYSFENNVYLCELKSEYTGNSGYIAIALDSNDNIFNLVYIE